MSIRQVTMKPTAVECQSLCLCVCAVSDAYACIREQADAQILKRLFDLNQDLAIAMITSHLRITKHVQETWRGTS